VYVMLRQVATLLQIRETFVSKENWDAQTMIDVSTCRNPTTPQAPLHMPSNHDPSWPPYIACIATKVVTVCPSITSPSLSPPTTRACQVMLERSSLMNDLKEVFHGLRDGRELNIMINGWIRLSIQGPQVRERCYAALTRGFYGLPTTHPLEPVQTWLAPYGRGPLRAARHGVTSGPTTPSCCWSASRGAFPTHTTAPPPPYGA
jgi:hypothetical protein